MSDTLADRLVAFALDTRYEDLPTAVVVEARRRLVDALGCAVGALEEPASSIARRVAARFQGTPSVGLIGGGTAAPDWAAFANGVHIRYLDCNDTYLSLEPAHPSDNWAAVMAAGEARRRRRQGLDHGRGGRLRSPVQALRRRQHPGPGLGPHHLRLDFIDPGGGQAAGPLARPNRPRARDRRHHGDRAAAHPRRRAVDVERAARSPSRPATGSSPTLLAADGPDRARPRSLKARWGSFSKFPDHFRLPKLGGPTAARLDAAQDLDQVRAGRVSQPVGHRRGVHVEAEDQRPREHPGHRDRHLPRGRRDHRQGPREMAAQDCAKRPTTASPIARPWPWSTARSRHRQFSPERLADPALIDLVSRTTVVEDPKLTAGYPAGIPNRVTVTLGDGTTLVEEVAFPPGHDKNPLTDQQLAHKFHGLVDPVLGRERAQAIWDRVSRLENDPDAAFGARS